MPESGGTSRVPGWRDLVGLARSTLHYRLNLRKRRRALAHYREFVPPGGLCFDVGAHLGDRTDAFLRLGARVVAVEPNPRLLEFLRRRYAGNQRVALVGAGLGAQAGRATLAISRRHPAVSSLSREWIEHIAAAPGFGGVRWDDAVEVPVTTLEALIAEFGVPGFCKIDVEGAEPEVLAGLERPLAALSFEFHAADPARSRACVDRLQALGRYRFNLSYAERLRLELAGWCDAEEIARRLEALPTSVASGDVYARRDPEDR